MGGNDTFDSCVRKLLGKEFNFQLDRPHMGKPCHVDLSVILPNLPEIGGADKTEVDFRGNVIGGATFAGRAKLGWDS